MIRVGLGRRTAVNRMTVPNPSFLLNFADLGSGQVSTVESVTASSPTFTRATIATTFDVNGNLVQVSTSGVPRSYYDPTSHAYLGYLAEGARTNIETNSQTASAGARSTVTNNAAVAPDGTNTAASIIEDTTATSTHFGLTTSVSLANTTVYTFSTFVKASGRTQVQVWASSSAPWGGTNQGAQFDLSAVSVIGTIGTSTGNIQKLSNGWFRCSFTTPATTALLPSAIQLNTMSGGTTTYTGDGTSGILVWGFQIEAASFASTYIPTTTGAVTKNKDQDVYTVTVPSAYTIVVKGRTPSAISGTQVFASYDDGSANNYTQVSYNSSGHLIADVVSGGVSQASLDLGAVAISTDFKVAVAVNVNDFAAVLNAGTAVTDAAGSVPVSPSKYNVNQDNAAANQSNSTSKSHAIYSQRLPTGVMAQLTQ